MPTREEKNEFSEMIMIRMQDMNTDCLDAIVTYCEEDTIVDGRAVLRDGKIVTFDEATVVEGAERAGADLLSRSK